MELEQRRGGVGGGFNVPAVCVPDTGVSAREGRPRLGNNPVSVSAAEGRGCGSLVPAWQWRQLWQVATVTGWRGNRSSPPFFSKPGRAAARGAGASAGGAEGLAHGAPSSLSTRDSPSATQLHDANLTTTGGWPPAPGSLAPCLVPAPGSVLCTRPSPCPHDKWRGACSTQSPCPNARSSPRITQPHHVSLQHWTPLSCPLQSQCPQGSRCPTQDSW